MAIRASKHSPILPASVHALLDLLLNPEGRAEWQRRPHLAQTSKGRVLVACDGPNMLVIGLPRWIHDPSLTEVFGYPDWTAAARTQVLGGPKHAPLARLTPWLCGHDQVQVVGAGLRARSGVVLPMAGPAHPRTAQIQTSVLADLLVMAARLPNAPTAATFQLRAGPSVLRPATASFGSLDHDGVVSVELLGSLFPVQLVLAALPVSF